MKNGVFVPKLPSFFAGILFAEHVLSEEIILNEVRMGGRATIKVTLASSVDFKWFQVGMS